jgi:hypothetical protein
LWWSQLSGDEERDWYKRQKAINTRKGAARKWDLLQFDQWHFKRFLVPPPDWGPRPDDKK